ncbi:MAG: hypothetical protein ACREHV_17850 [Rhizomicrobium sp.]
MRLADCASETFLPPRHDNDKSGDGMVITALRDDRMVLGFMYAVTASVSWKAQSALSPTE